MPRAQDIDHTKFHVSTDILLDTDPPSFGVNDDRPRPQSPTVGLSSSATGTENPLTRKKTV